MEAKAGPGTSYAWRSLSHGTDLVRQGYIWKIGTGSKVNIWRDPWIMRAWSRKVITPRNGNMLERVNGVISPVDGRDSMEDFIAWHYDSKGLHTMKMAYKLHAQISGLNGDERGNTSSGGQGDLRAYADRCKKVKEVWRDLELEGTRMRLEDTITAGEALNIMWELPKRERMEVFHFMWNWWNSRTKKRNGEQVKSGQVIADDAQAMTHAFDLASELGVFRVEMESDSEMLVNVVNNPFMDFSLHAVVLEDVKMQMRTWFPLCEMKTCSREANMAAHSLAKLVLTTKAIQRASKSTKSGNVGEQRDTDLLPLSLEFEKLSATCYTLSVNELTDNAILSNSIT
ncbi:hypothetical protein D1007_04050 [Hordeum vulgare]|nr:hypothetical protein D1007_04050 [Hordeum vulgare]